MEKNEEKLIGTPEEGSINLAAIRFEDESFSAKVARAFYDFFIDTLEKGND